MDAIQIEVMVIEDHLSMRKGVELLLQREGMRIAGAAGDLEEARALLERRQWDVALIDVHLGSESGLELVADVMGRDPAAAIVLYTGFTAPDEGLEQAIRVGARGFVLKSSPAPRLIDAIRGVAAGGTFVDPDLAGLLTEGADASRVTLLSPREREILQLLAQGMTGHAIAQQLFLSPETVRTHIRNATGKLGAKTRVHAVAMVTGHGFGH